MLVFTDAGKAYRNRAYQNGTPFNPIKFVYANVPGLNPTATPPQNEAIPLSAVVYEHGVTLKSKVDNNHVIFSDSLGSDIGDFNFNWVGLVARENDQDILLYVKYSAVLPKRKQNLDVGQEGNTLSQSFGVRFAEVASLAQVSIPAQAWQYDFSTEIQQVVSLEISNLSLIAASMANEFKIIRRLENLERLNNV